MMIIISQQTMNIYENRKTFLEAQFVLIEYYFINIIFSALQPHGAASTHPPQKHPKLNMPATLPTPPCKRAAHLGLKKSAYLPTPPLTYPQCRGTSPLPWRMYATQRSSLTCTSSARPRRLRPRTSRGRLGGGAAVTAAPGSRWAAAVATRPQRCRGRGPARAAGRCA